MREAITRKIPIVLVVGEQEETDGAVTVRRYGEEAQERMPFAAFTEVLAAEIASRAMRRKPGI